MKLEINKLTPVIFRNAGFSFAKNIFSFYNILFISFLILTASAFPLMSSSSAAAAGINAAGCADYAPLPCDKPDIKEFKKLALLNKEDKKPEFTAYTIDAYPEYPYNITSIDVDSDGREELIVSKIVSSHDPKGFGAVDIYKLNNPADLTAWTKTRIAADIRFPNKVSAADINGDQKLDFVIPYGSIVHDANFGGGIVWLERQGFSGFRKRVITAAPKLMYRHAVLCDINGDSRTDIVAVAETTGAFGDGESAVHIFLGNKSETRFERTPLVAGKGAGGFPCVFDIDNDGDLDIASAEFYGSSGSFSWFENPGNGQWTKHYIDETAGKAFQLAIVPNLFGEGTFTAVGTNHTNIFDNPNDRESALFVYEKPLNPRFSWPRIRVSADFRPRQSNANSLVRQKAPGAFACGNIDGDRDLDIVVNGAGDPNVYLLTQTSPRKFAMSVLAAEMPHGSVAIADYDGDAVSDIILSSAENNRLMIFKYNKTSQTPKF
jgi:hypothetical protein